MYLNTNGLIYKHIISPFVEGYVVTWILAFLPK